LRSNGDQEGARGNNLVELLGESEQAGGARAVGKAAGRIGDRRDVPGLHCSGRKNGRSVHENDHFGRADGFGQFGGPLRRRVDGGFRFTEAGTQLARNVQGRSVIPAKRVATRENERANHGVRRNSSSSLPSGETRRRCSGMCPSAWVAQLRHGSNARITASTRFNMPSVSFSARTKWRAAWRMPRFIARLLWPVAMIR